MHASSRRSAPSSLPIARAHAGMASARVGAGAPSTAPRDDFLSGVSDVLTRDCWVRRARRRRMSSRLVVPPARSLDRSRTRLRRAVRGPHADARAPASPPSPPPSTHSSGLRSGAARPQAPLRRGQPRVQVHVVPGHQRHVPPPATPPRALARARARLRALGRSRVHRRRLLRLSRRRMGHHRAHLRRRVRRPTPPPRPLRRAHPRLPLQRLLELRPRRRVSRGIHRVSPPPTRGAKPNETIQPYPHRRESNPRRRGAPARVRRVPTVRPVPSRETARRASLPHVRRVRPGDGPPLSLPRKLRRRG